MMNLYYLGKLMAKVLPSLILVGPMGAGKSTIGRLLAKQLHRNFVDTDHHIEENTGADIPWIFAIEGEAGFRQRETKALKKLIKHPKQILATGGGVVMKEENRHLLKQAGLVIFLHADVETQWQRTKRDHNRPLINQKNPKQVLQELYDLRLPLYREVAHIEVMSKKMSTKKMAMLVLEKIRELDYDC